MGAPESKSRWLLALREDRTARVILRKFAPHYYYFSLRQVLAFSGLLRLIPPNDTGTLCQLSDVLYEELGRGNPERVHSVLFRRFATAAGAQVAVPLTEDDVLPGIRRYAEELENRFVHGPLEEALATYVFLERSANDTYPALLATLQTLGFTAEEIEFFALHTEVEVEHERSARELMEQYCTTAERRARADAQMAKMDSLWTGFWDDIDAHTRAR
jgi:pyrroloquinoline quinone (PQQ) biosynthesis protein C